MSAKANTTISIMLELVQLPESPNHVEAELTQQIIDYIAAHAASVGSVENRANFRGVSQSGVDIHDLVLLYPLDLLNIKNKIVEFFLSISKSNTGLLINCGKFRSAGYIPGIRETIHDFLSDEFPVKLKDPVEMLLKLEIFVNDFNLNENSDLWSDPEMIANDRILCIACNMSENEKTYLRLVKPDVVYDII